MKILQLSYRVPFPPNDGGAIGIYNIVKGYSEAGHTVHLLSINTPKHFQTDNVLADICKQTNVFVNTDIKPIKALLNLFTALPYNVARFINKDVENKLSEILRTENFDVIHVDGVFMAHYIHIIRHLSKCPVLIRTHNIEYVIWERLAKSEKNLLKKWYFNLIVKRLKAFETHYYNLFDGIAAISKEDADRLLEMNVTKPALAIIPAGVNEEKFKYDPTQVPEKNTIFSISALDWMPNQEAIYWFLDDIWPAVNEAYPELKLHIAGKSTPEKLLKAIYPNVKLHGMVPDAVKFMQAYDIMIVPLLSGGGMRLKIIEAMALGKCIISSQVGAEGIDYTDYKNIIICNTVNEWVHAIGKCINDTHFKNNIENAALQLAEDKYLNTSVTKRYIDFIGTLKKVKN